MNIVYNKIIAWLSVFFLILQWQSGSVKRSFTNHLSKNKPNQKHLLHINAWWRLKKLKYCGATITLFIHFFERTIKVSFFNSIILFTDCIFFLISDDCQDCTAWYVRISTDSSVSISLSNPKDRGHGSLVGSLTAAHYSNIIRTVTIETIGNTRN